MHQQQIAFENIVGKEEIAHDKQFLLFPCFLLNQKIVSPFVHIFDIISLFATELEVPQCFQKACLPGASKSIIVWEWVKLWLLCTSMTIIILHKNID